MPGSVQAGSEVPTQAPRPLLLQSAGPGALGDCPPAPGASCLSGLHWAPKAASRLFRPGGQVKAGQLAGCFPMEVLSLRPSGPVTSQSDQT